MKRSEVSHRRGAQSFTFFLLKRLQLNCQQKPEMSRIEGFCQSFHVIRRWITDCQIGSIRNVESCRQFPGSACFSEPLLVTLDPKTFGSTTEAKMDHRALGYSNIFLRILCLGAACGFLVGFQTWMPCRCLPTISFPMATGWCIASLDSLWRLEGLDNLPTVWLESLDCQERLPSLAKQLSWES